MYANEQEMKVKNEIFEASTKRLITFLSFYSKVQSFSIITRYHHQVIWIRSVHENINLKQFTIISLKQHFDHIASI